MGFVLSGLNDAGRPAVKTALLSVSVVGIALALFVWCWANQLRRVKVAKYRRCKALEELLGMEQHTALQYAAGSQTWSYAVLMVIFLLAWLVLAVLVACARTGWQLAPPDRLRRRVSSGLRSLERGDPEPSSKHADVFPTIARMIEQAYRKHQRFIPAQRSPRVSSKVPKIVIWSRRCANYRRIAVGAEQAAAAGG